MICSSALVLFRGRERHVHQYHVIRIHHLLLVSVAQLERKQLAVPVLKIGDASVGVILTNGQTDKHRSDILNIRTKKKRNALWLIFVILPMQCWREYSSRIPPFLVVLAGTKEGCSSFEWRHGKHRRVINKRIDRLAFANVLKLNVPSGHGVIYHRRGQHLQLHMTPLSMSTVARCNGSPVGLMGAVGSKAYRKCLSA